MYGTINIKYVCVCVCHDRRRKEYGIYLVLVGSARARVLSCLCVPACLYMNAANAF